MFCELKEKTNLSISPRFSRGMTTFYVEIQNCYLILHVQSLSLIDRSLSPANLI